MNIITVTLNPAVDLTVNTEAFQIDAINSVQSMRKDSGGKGINVSKVLHNLGFRTTATGFIGGATGDWIKKDLNSKNIATDFIELQQDTRTNIKIIDSTSETQLNGLGPMLTEADIRRLEQKLQRIVRDGDAVIFAGSVPNETDPAIYSRLIHSLQNFDLFIAVDTSGPALADVVHSKPHFMKPNQQELGQLFGKENLNEAEIIHFARRLTGSGIKLVLVSRGAEGSLLVSEDEVYKAVPPEIEVKSSIGAGDSTVAGFVAQYLTTGDLHSSFLFANACGVSTALHAGSQVCTKEDVKTQMQRIICTHIEKGEFV